jgi:uncharacterized protein with PIN domain
MVDTIALMKFLAAQVAIVVAIYFVILFLLRISNYYRITRCPVCGGALSRHKRKGLEKWMIAFSFGILPVKRYRCYSCYWEGQAFEFKKEPKALVDRSDVS